MWWQINYIHHQVIILEVIYAHEGWPKVIFEEHFIIADVVPFTWFMGKCVNHSFGYVDQWII
jgi:hypothetical protein